MPKRDHDPVAAQTLALEKERQAAARAGKHRHHDPVAAATLEAERERVAKLRAKNPLPAPMVSDAAQLEQDHADAIVALRQRHVHELDELRQAHDLEMSEAHKRMAALEAALEQAQGDNPTE